MTVSLDLGSGPVPKNPFGADKVYGVDINPEYAKRGEIFICDMGANTPWEIAVGSLDYIVCTDFLEHIPRTGYRPEPQSQMWESELPRLVPYNPFIFCMNQVYEMLKPGGIFQAKTPAYPHPQAFQDPTHVNIITDQTVQYFVRGGMLELGQAYGFTGEFELLEQYWDQDVPYWLVWELQKPR